MFLNPSQIFLSNYYNSAWKLLCFYIQHNIYNIIFSWNQFSRNIYILERKRIMKGETSSVSCFIFKICSPLQENYKNRTTKIFQGTLKKSTKCRCSRLIQNLNKNDDLKYYYPVDMMLLGYWLYNYDNFFFKSHNTLFRLFWKLFRG